MELDPFAHDFHDDPYPTYQQLRDNAPCYHNERLDFYALSRYDDVLDASQQPLLFSSAEGTTLERINTAALNPMMIFMDPPEHDVNRKVVSRVFTARAVSALEPYIRATAVGCLDRLREQGGGDFVEEFSAVLPMNVVMELLGVPAADRDQLRRWTDASLERSEDPPYVTPAALHGMAEMHGYWERLVPAKRADPDDGLISRLCGARVTDDGGASAALTDNEVIGFCAMIAAAGTETVTKLLANAVVLFHRHPRQWQTLLDDPGLIPGAVDEVLRFWAPSQYQGRVLTADVTAHGVTMPAGSRVLLLTGSANRDERRYDDPAVFDVRRSIHVPVGFGHGTHFCLGAALARLESRIAWEEFAARFPRFEVDESRARRVHMSNVHGFASVPFAAA